MELTRRNFLKGAAAVAGVAGVGALAGVKAARADEVAAEDAGTITYDQTIKWDGQYDVVVVGFGAAGASASIHAADAGASVLLLEKAPLGDEGGNSRFCAQLFANGRGDVDEVLAYYTNLCGEFEVPQDMLQYYAEGIAGIAETYAELFELDINDFYNCTEDSESATARAMYVMGLSPEYPEFVTNQDCPVVMGMLHDGGSDAYMWSNYRAQVVKRADSIDVWLESPAVALIQEPNTKTILGVTVSRGGEKLNIRATNGVVLACGGFENNVEMKKDYLGLANSTYYGTAYNTGDGINMAKAAGADLWHMHVWESSVMLAGLSYPLGEGERSTSIIKPTSTGAYFVVGTDGYRIFNEDEIARHGHIYNNGVWDNPWFPAKEFVVWDETNASYIDTVSAYVDYLQADTIAELAELMGTDPEILQQTVDEFNAFVEAGCDYAFHRPVSTMQAFGEGPYYAIEAAPGVLNTQGGPRRNANAEVVDIDGNAIPHLYSAGECGGITSNHYQGGGNMAECLLFGKLAGINAAAEKDPLDPYVVEAVESDLVYTLGTGGNDLTAVLSVEDYEAECGENEYVGSATGIGGDIIVKVTTEDGMTITDLEVLYETETEDRGGVALEELVPAIIEAGTTEGIDAVSGATVTSNALFEAIAEALAKAAE